MSSHPNAQPRAHSHIGFNAQLHEAGTGWQLLGNGHRAYSPMLMRFHSPDTLSPMERGGINAYTYCEGEPIGRSDPSGRFFIQAAVMAAVVGGAAVSGAVLVKEPEQRAFFISIAALAFGVSAGAGTKAFLKSRKRPEPPHISSPIPRSGRPWPFDDKRPRINGWRPPKISTPVRGTVRANQQVPSGELINIQDRDVNFMNDSGIRPGHGAYSDGDRYYWLGDGMNWVTIPKPPSRSPQATPVPDTPGKSASPVAMTSSAVREGIGRASGAFT